MSPWTILWIIWLAAFVSIELPAARKPGVTTLSEHLWRWFTIKDPDQAWWRKWLLRAFLVLLTLHLGWGFL